MEKKDKASEFKDTQIKIQQTNANYWIDTFLEGADEPYLPDIASAAVTAENTRKKTELATEEKDKCKEQERRINTITDDTNGTVYRIGAKSKSVYLEEV